MEREREREREKERESSEREATVAVGVGPKGPTAHDAEQGRQAGRQAGKPCSLARSLALDTNKTDNKPTNHVSDLTIKPRPDRRKDELLSFEGTNPFLTQPVRERGICIQLSLARPARMKADW